MLVKFITSLVVISISSIATANLSLHEVQSFKSDRAYTLSGSVKKPSLDPRDLLWGRLTTTGHELVSFGTGKPVVYWFGESDQVPVRTKKLWIDSYKSYSDRESLPSIDRFISGYINATDNSGKARYSIRGKKFVTCIGSSENTSFTLVDDFSIDPSERQFGYIERCVSADAKLISATLVIADLVSGKELKRIPRASSFAWLDASNLIISSVPKHAFGTIFQTVPKTETEFFIAKISLKNFSAQRLMNFELGDQSIRYLNSVDYGIVDQGRFAGIILAHDLSQQHIIRITRDGRLDQVYSIVSKPLRFATSITKDVFWMTFAEYARIFESFNFLDRTIVPFPADVPTEPEVTGFHKPYIVENVSREIMPGQSRSFTKITTLTNLESVLVDLNSLSTPEWEVEGTSQFDQFFAVEFRSNITQKFLTRVFEIKNSTN